MFLNKEPIIYLKLLKINCMQSVNRLIRLSPILSDKSKLILDKQVPLMHMTKFIVINTIYKHQRY